MSVKKTGKDSAPTNALTEKEKEIVAALNAYNYLVEGYEKEKVNTTKDPTLGGLQPKFIDPEEVKRMAAEYCTNVEIGHAVGCSVATLERRFADIIKEGRSSGKRSLRSMQWNTAKSGNVAMQIWLGKQYLGQTEKTVTMEGDATFNFVDDGPNEDKI